MIRYSIRYLILAFILLVVTSCTGRSQVFESESAITSLAWSPYGQTLASGSTDGTLDLWDPTQRDPLRTMQTPNWINNVAWSPDGGYLASGSLSALAESTILLWNPLTGVRINAIPVPTPNLWTMAWSPDARTLAAGTDDKVILWNIASGQVSTLEGHTGIVLSLGWSPGGQVLASGSQDGTLLLWNVTTGKQLRKVTSYPDDYISSLAWSPDGGILATTSCSAKSGVLEYCLILILDPSTGSRLHTLQGDSIMFTDLAWSPNGKILAAGSLEGPITLWDTGTWKQLRTFKGHVETRSLAWSPDGYLLASGSEDGIIIIWRVSR
jgi:WD40 repeat protein